MYNFWKKDYVQPSGVVCHHCRKLFELTSQDVCSAKRIIHHSTTESFVSSIKAGCPICRAILSEVDDPQKLFLYPFLISLTECLIREPMNGSVYDLGFTWKSPGIPKRYRRVLVQRYDLIKQFLPRIPPAADRGWNNQTLEVVKKWMRCCRKEHPNCQALNAWRTAGLDFQPKRLVDIGSDSGRTWRLVLTGNDNIFRSPYVTISHRWSQNQQFKLISETIEAYTADQPVSDLPRIFQDAVQVVKSLGIRYLWVDCLCIIQDSHLDWQRESLEMCKIYTNAICNISITGFEDTSNGFLDQTCRYAPLPCRVQPRWAPSLREGWCILDPFFWWAQVTKAPLTKRGWVFQERFLAPRVVHFGPDQIL
ncbi:heterokaryon incompatibility protein-domain-containing protein [Xylaria bambusicola]|uniref:heterokaryon incompatibility protein-domain-containing protein n=1 Tax=Xylaria bambusicola TaxID=326684 RepID=UPI0020075973|nr:heterokaryon incompatibility protein-domain-containing protein [Xylaria bambusicola]KAI0513004.1 heterokaryon incompatibility protein-domain-containing protein [Xylaria bambusicola]